MMLFNLLINAQTKGKIEDLIKKNQRLPGSIIMSILERFEPLWDFLNSTKKSEQSNKSDIPIREKI